MAERASLDLVREATGFVASRTPTTVFPLSPELLVRAASATWGETAG